MTNYKAIVAFVDLQDNNRVYHPGDKFPWDDKKVSNKRIIELATDKNKLHKPVIEKVEEETEAEIETKTEAEIESETKTETSEAAPVEAKDEPAPVKKKASRKKKADENQ